MNMSSTDDETDDEAGASEALEAEDDEDDDEPEPEPPPPSFTREEFLEWRSPRYGATNPERLSNPVWTWLVQTGINAWSANQRFDGPSALRAGPGWCFERFGRSTTELPDGRTILIAGEHEDYYDPDFYIYNDVVVRHPDGRVEIFSYPREVFPPTDFHSATLVGDRIILIGSAGYAGERRPGHTQVLALALATFTITTIPTGGTPPGWIFRHTATLTDDGRAIAVQRGKLDRGDNQSLVENIDDWRLDLDTWQWQRLAHHRWPRRELRRSDGQRNHVSELRQACWYRGVGWAEQLEQTLADLERALGGRPDLDLAALLFRPSIAHEQLTNEDDAHDTTRITVDGVVVRFVRNAHSLQLTVEGELPESTVDAIADELRDRLSLLENAPFAIARIDND